MIEDEDRSADTSEESEDTGSSAADTPTIRFPIVGVGASAGGLECYRKLLAALPPDPGVAFVLVQHLDPSHESMMAELLNRHSGLPVREVEDGVRIEPNHVYMIPPNKFMRLADHGLFLDEPVKRRGMRMPIDYFFRSLAEVQRERAICIVLSGTGTDGTQGLREVKAAGGMAMVQDPKSAEYDGMPRSALGTGMADFMLEIEAMPKALLEFIRQPYLMSKEMAPGLSQTEPEAFRAILNLLLAQTDYDFRCYKRGTLERRIQRRMSLHNIPSASEYLRRLRDDRDELLALFKDLLIGVTRFFRDAHVWESLQDNVIAEIVANRSYNDPVRVWVPGCASGEEAYSIAILFFEEFERQRRSLPLQIYATDLDEEAIEVARSGRYPDSIAADISIDRLEKFFVASEQSFVVAKRVREVIVFATQNVISDPPFSRIDLISCRNLLIYLDGSIQNRLLENFHFALNEGGFLLLGTSESVEKAGRLFDKVPTVERCFRRIDTARPARALLVDPPGRRESAAPVRRRPMTDFADVAQVESAKNVLLDAFAPASVLVDRRYQIRYFHGPLRDYLDLPRGEPEIEVVSLAVEGLKGKLRTALNRAQETNDTVEEVARRVRRNGDIVTVRIRVSPILHRGANREPLLVVSFIDEKKEPGKRQAQPEEPPSEQESSLIDQLEYELQAVREDYQSAIEELETSNEELKASNEEVMSMNEELQSTNEELETSREELQSLNEELSTVNSQLQEKLQELESSNNDLSNLLASTEIATLFLDSDLCIRRFTPASTHLLNVIGGDIGRPISDLAPNVDDPTLLDDCRAVLRDLQPREADVSDKEGHAQLRRIRPYRTSDNRIEGVVVTYSDVTRLRAVMETLRRRERQQAAVSRLGQSALAGKGLDDLFQEAVLVAADLLDCTHAKVLERQADQHTLLLRRSRGFKKATDGETRVPFGLDSQAGFTLRESGPVIVKNLQTEKRFSGPSLLVEAGILSGISVLIGSADKPWGVFGVHSTEPRDFSVDDVAFVQSVANLLATAINLHRSRGERNAIAAQLDATLDATNIATWVWNFETDRAEWDERMWKLFDVPDDFEPTSERFFEMVVPEDRAPLREQLEESLRTGEMLDEEFRVRHGDGIRWIAVIGRPMVNPDGERRMFGVSFDITERIESHQQLAESEQRREMAVRAAQLGAWEYYPDVPRIVADERFKRMFGFDPEGGLDIGQLKERVHPDDWAGQRAALDDAIERADHYEAEYRIYVDGSERWIRSQGRVFPANGSSEGPRVVGLAEDVTDRKRSEERQQLLMAELDHRVKNILANVNAIARQTAYSRSDPDSFVDALEGRLAALSDTHSLLSVSRWSGVDLRALLQAEIAPYSSPIEDRLLLEGDRFVLSPRAAQTLCLFIHELVTNAAKHGALAHETGKLSISWSVEDETFRLVWVESGGEPIQPPTRRGFGLSVIEEMTASDLGAEVTLDFREQGLRCVLTVPKDEIVAKDDDEAVFSALPIRQSWDRQSAENLRILIVEDVWTVARHLASILRTAGHEVAGSAARLDDGLALAEMEGIDAAILDVRLGTDLVFPIADRLAERGVPFGFATGYADSDVIPERFDDRPVLSKPYTSDAIMTLAARLRASE